MYKLLREIRSPNQIQFATPLIKREALGLIHTHEHIIEAARREASDIIHQAHQDAERIRLSVRAETAQDFQQDWDRLQQLVQQSNTQRLRETAELCNKILGLALARLFDEMPQTQRIRVLTESLLSETESAREVVLECNPAVQSEVEFQLSDALKEVLGARRCTVNPMDDMDLDTLKLRSTNGAEIVVSLKNIQALLQQEIERCLGTLDIVGSQA